MPVPESVCASLNRSEPFKQRVIRVYNVWVDIYCRLSSCCGSILTMHPTGFTTLWRSVRSVVQLADLTKTQFVRMDSMELLQNSISSFCVKDHGVGGVFAHPEVLWSAVPPGV